MLQGASFTMFSRLTLGTPVWHHAGMWNIVKLGENQVNPHRISKNLGPRRFSMCEQMNIQISGRSLMVTAGTVCPPVKVWNLWKQTPPKRPCRCNPIPVKRWIWCWDLQTSFSVGFLKQFDYHPLKLLLGPCWSGYLIKLVLMSVIIILFYIRRFVWMSSIPHLVFVQCSNAT